MSLRTGISVESLGELKFAADEQSGSSLETIEKATKRMASTLFDANDGVKASVESLEALGLEASDFEGLNAEEQFMELAGALGQVKDSSEQAALAQKIFGKAGTELIPLFEQGFEGMDKLRAEAVALGGVMSGEAASSAAAFADAQNALKTSIAGVGLELAEKIVPVLTTMIQLVTENKGVMVALGVAGWGAGPRAGGAGGSVGGRTR